MADPSLTPTAVEEIVRWASPVGWMRRTATRDVELHGHSFGAGDKLRIEVDRDLCASTGGCEALAPDVFESADDGALVVRTTEPDPADLPDVRDAVQMCPTRALRLVE